MMDDRTHPLNEGRESLFDLEIGKNYLVTGTYAASHATYKETNTRITLLDVLVREYRTDIAIDEIPVIAFCQHINSVRKLEGLKHTKMREGEQTFWIGELEEYESVRNPGIKRRSLKLKRDVAIHKELSDLEARMRNMNSILESLSPSDLDTRLHKTQKMIERVEEILENFRYVPHLSQTEIQQRLAAIKQAMNKLQIYLQGMPAERYASKAESKQYAVST